jgi:hypothetical protein
LWFIGYYGREMGLRRFKDAGLRIKHPDEFNTAQLLTVVEEARQALSLNLGATAEKLIKKNTIPILVPNVTADQKKEIEKEIDAQPSQAELADTFKLSVARAAEEGGNEPKDPNSEQPPAPPAQAA